MAVETRFIVVRNNTEVKTFMDKKSADEYDKMLDIADNLDNLLSASPIALSEKDRESLSIHLAQKREELLIALQAKKAKPSPKKIATEPTLEPENIIDMKDENLEKAS